MAGSKLTVGNVEILTLEDTETALPLNMLFPQVPAEAWGPYQQRYPEAFASSDTGRIHFCSFLLRSEGKTILLDTGIGSNATNGATVTALAGGVDGHLLVEFQSAGVKLEDVDTVFLSHLHPDHVGWNLTQSNDRPQPTFPKARYIAHQADWDAFKAPKDQELFSFSFWDQTIAPLENLGVLDLVSGEQALTGEITAIPTPGHTPGSMSLAIISAGQRALLLGDVFHNPAQVTENDWSLAFDMDPAGAIETRKQMFNRAEAENALVAICHHSGFGRVARAEGRRYWQGI